MTTATALRCAACGVAVADAGLCLRCWDEQVDRDAADEQLHLGRTPRLNGRAPVEVQLAAHGTHARAQICSDSCRDCGPIRERNRARQHARYEQARACSRNRGSAP